MTTAVRAERVAVRLGGNQVLDHVDLEVAEGELVALLGPSGCGKTTLLRVLAGLQVADEGTVCLAGRDVTALPARRREIGFVFQSYGLFPTMTAQANVEFPLRVKGRRSPSERARELLGLMGMADLGGRRPAELSGGQQQRVALARALAREPEVLLLDEPLSALDAVIRDSLRDEIRALQQRLGLAVVHVTHDQAEALAMADRVAVMSRGAIVEVGPPRQIYDRPSSVFTARFVGGRNEVALAPGPGGTLGWGSGLVVADTGADVVAALFPPEAVSVEATGLGEPATVVLSSFQGATVRLHLEAAGTTIIAERPAAEAARFPPGSACTVSVDPAAITPVPRAEALP